MTNSTNQNILYYFYVIFCFKIFYINMLLFTLTEIALLSLHNGNTEI